MSREIKFRAWDKQLNEWYGASFDDMLTFNGFSLFGECTMFCMPPVEYFQYLEVMQYTGLKDKNGVEIYEGDIIDTHVKSGRYMEVYFNSEAASFMTRGLKDIEWVKTGGLGKDMCSYIEVIGNIHKNPELLKETN